MAPNCLTTSDNEGIIYPSKNQTNDQCRTMRLAISSLTEVKMFKKGIPAYPKKVERQKINTVTLNHTNQELKLFKLH